MELKLNHKIFKPAESPSFRVISFGAGVQSTVMALLSVRGAFGPRPDHMIFADTGWEPRGIYDHLRWAGEEIKRLSNGQTQLHIVKKGDIRKNVIESINTTGQRFVALPFFTADGGMGRRQCTSEYKIAPIEKKIRELAGLKYRQRAPASLLIEQWIGISWDEKERVRISDKKYIHMRYPLLELEWTRSHCIKWFNENYPGIPLKKSSCIGCPFHDNAHWRDMRDNDTESWNDAVEVDKLIRSGGSGTLRGMNSAQYMHHSRKPLDEADLSSAAERGQNELGFNMECQGMCGL